MNALWFNMSLEESVDAKRLHHQLFPMSIAFEHDYDERIVEELRKIGHDYTIAKPEDGFSAITAISRKNGVVEAKWDKRRSGRVVLF